MVRVRYLILNCKRWLNFMVLKSCVSGTKFHLNDSNVKGSDEAAVRAAAYVLL